MHQDIIQYNELQLPDDKAICDLLASEIDASLPKAESKVWHSHPVWFLEGNPIVGYAKRKNDIQLLFWSGQSFDETGLEIEGTFKAAQKRYKNVQEVNTEDLRIWLQKSENIQWDYKNIVKRKGGLEKLKGL
ncbi:MAG: DUF1801 domain-containing protein [Candidatus Gracilibacteria bacterium]